MKLADINLIKTNEYFWTSFYTLLGLRLCTLEAIVTYSRSLEAIVTYSRSTVEDFRIRKLYAANCENVGPIVQKYIVCNFKTRRRHFESILRPFLIMQLLQKGFCFFVSALDE